MQWILKYLRSSIGRKQIMGLAGLGLAGFLVGHMVGNLPLIFPGAADSYNAYTYFLTGTLAKILPLIEIGLVVLFVAHFGTAIMLKLENIKARGKEGYLVNSYSGNKEGKTKRSIASFTMIYSGVFILVFLILHLTTMKYGTHYVTILNGIEVRDMYKTVMEEFGKLWYAVFYAVSMIILAVHLVHAINSAFQTMGLNHIRWNPIVNAICALYVIVVGGGFTVTAIAAHLVATGVIK